MSSLYYLIIQIPRSEDAKWEKGFNFDDRRLMKGQWRNERNPDVCMVTLGF